MTTDANEAEPVCVHCREPIRPGARRCPMCLSWQSRWAADSRNPGLEIALVAGLVLAMTVVVISWAYLRGDDSSAASAGNRAASLHIVQSALEVVGTGEQRHVVVVGTLDNRSDAALRDIYFYVELSDAGGNTIDAFHARLATMVVPPRSTVFFKLADGDPLKHLEEYAGCSVQIRHASAIP